MKNDFLCEYEYKKFELEDFTEMFGILIDDYFAESKPDIYTKANNYERLRPFFYNMHLILLSLVKEMTEKIDKEYEERNRGKNE